MTTNLEWMRTLSAKELVNVDVHSCKNCAFYYSCNYNQADNCTEGHIKWLNQEHKEEIKPCANCGGKAIFAVAPMRINPELGCVQCCECHIRTPVGTKHNVINIWNRRVDNVDKQKHEEEIKSCLCGGKPFVNQDSNYYWISCSCGAHGPYGTTKEEAIKAWNSRRFNNESA